uniref:3'-5' exonuclease domain-containing protein n=1 Tax=Romanomermis culicivorax TaxID=13658 RepID=A0A915J423_ROMCU
VHDFNAENRSQKFNVLSSAKYLDKRPRIVLPIRRNSDEFGYTKKCRQETSVLLQLATWSGHVILIRLCYLETIPDALKAFLADGAIIKLGVGTEIDACRLWNDWGLAVRGWLDLRAICVHLGLEYNEYIFKKMSLKHLGLTLFGETRFAPAIMKKLSFSDWTVPRLSRYQLFYAAWDAQIAVDIFSFVTQMLFSIAKPDKNDTDYCALLSEKCREYVEMPRFDDDLLPCERYDYEESVKFTDDDYGMEKDPPTPPSPSQKFDASLLNLPTRFLTHEEIYGLNRPPNDNILDRTLSNYHLGFHAHVKSHRFDRKLFESIKQEYGVAASLEKYMDEKKQKMDEDSHRSKRQQQQRLLPPPQPLFTACGRRYPPRRGAVGFHDENGGGSSTVSSSCPSMRRSAVAPLYRGSTPSTMTTRQRSFWRSGTRRAVSTTTRFSGWQFYRGILPPRFAAAHSYQQQRKVQHETFHDHCDYYEADYSCENGTRDSYSASLY